MNGVKGQKIGEQNLKLIFSSLPGNETGLEGQKLYKGIDGNDYHYVFWLNDTFAGQKVGKQEAFLAANKDAVPISTPRIISSVIPSIGLTVIAS